MVDYNSFKSRVLNKGFDHDHYYGWQCWDGFAEYCSANNLPNIDTTPVSKGGTGYVQDLWTFRSTNGMLKYFDEVVDMETGDVGVFKVHPWTPYSHVAIFDSDIDGEYGWFLGQNQGSELTNPEGGSAFNLCKLPYEALFDTAFRIKPNRGGAQVALPTKDVNGDIFSGLITDVDPNIMNADQNRLPIDRIVIHHNAGTSDEGARRTWYVSTGVGTSAHYQVANNKIWGCVGENSVAYHAGDYNMNQRSIGIEHLNSTGAPTWLISEETYRSSAKLIRDICERYGIPIDRAHILKHGEVSATGCPGGIDIDRLVRMARENNVATVEDKKPTAQMYVGKIDHKAMTAEVVIHDIKSPSGIDRYQLPNWTDKNGQDDLKWHQIVATDTNPKVFTVRGSERNNEHGKYIAHGYIVTPSGKQWGVGGVEFYLGEEYNPTCKIDAKYHDGKITVKAYDIKSPNGLRGVSFPTWSEKNGQDDIKWYGSDKQSDGSYVKVIDLKDHKELSGEFNIHCYAIQGNGQLAGMGGVKVSVPEEKNMKDEIVVVTKANTEIKHVVVTEEEFERLKAK